MMPASALEPWIPDRKLMVWKKVCEAVEKAVMEDLLHE